MPTPAQLDRQYVWHPFTQMRDWLRQKPIVLVEGRGSELVDAQGRRYLDANASIWTNLHGHRQPTIDRAIRKQLQRLAHSSALGLANEPAARLAERLVRSAQPLRASRGRPLRKVFFSDDGSTAMEVALKLAYEFARRSGRSARPRFLSLGGAYHGDTLGAVSVGHIDLFHRAYAQMLFRTESVMSPYCYRCPFNRARPERADARVSRSCHWECVDLVEQKVARQRRRKNPLAAMVVEPSMQGAAGMIAQPQGWLRRVAQIVQGDGAQLIADEVMTGFGRTGGQSSEALFACQLEGVRPDFLAVAKGLTGGYLPMAATLTTQPVFDAFLGEYAEFRTFFHGHSYSGNQLGSAAALASLDLLQSPVSVRARNRLEDALQTMLNELWQHPSVGDIRRVGLVAGIELVKDWTTRRPFALRERAGIRVCEAMARRGVLTRPIGNVIVLMPPYCTTPAQVREIGAALMAALGEVLPAPRSKMGAATQGRPRS